jgi:hypothetical protein
VARAERNGNLEGDEMVRLSMSILAVLVCSQRATGQSTASRLERIALRAAVERAIGSAPSHLRIVIDPTIVYANEAPGGRDSVARSAERNDSLARSFGARIQARSSVLDCSAHPCELLDADVLVSLSEPQIVGNDAKVTVTTVQRLKRGTQYKTVNVILRGSGRTWKVVGFEDLGMS